MIRLAAYMELAVACYTDVRRSRIPNRMLLLFFLINLWLGMFYGWRHCVSGVLFPFILFPLYLWNVLGAGDIKLFSVIGILLGGRAVVSYVWISFVFGAVLSLGIMLYRGCFKERMSYFLAFAAKCFQQRKRAPYRQKNSREGTFPFTTAMMLGFCFMDLTRGISL